MFVRVKKSGAYEYLQIVHNERVEGRVQQHVIGTLGRLDVLQKSGQLDGLLASCARFAEHSAVLSAHRQGRIPPAEKVRIGPVLVFERLWQEMGLPKILGRLLQGRKFEFDVERAVFLTVLHRLFAPGSDRAAEVWRQQYALEGVEKLQLHHLYRAMAWLGESLPEGQQAHATPFAPRSVKDLVEESLFGQTRDLFSGLDLVFFDTTSIYFEGEGGETIGQYGHSKDHRPDRKQMVVGVILDGQGRPVCCELWPGNTADVTTLIPIVDRLKHRFHIRSVCVVADRGMISRDTIRQLQAADRDVRYILGARLRSVKEIYEVVLRRPGRYHQVYGPKGKVMIWTPWKRLRSTPAVARSSSAVRHKATLARRSKRPASPLAPWFDWKIHLPILNTAPENARVVPKTMRDDLTDYPARKYDLMMLKMDQRVTDEMDCVE
ncbi:MAG: IS1634 family transposase, partial [Methyloceanibacter sp.]